MTFHARQTCRLCGHAPPRCATPDARLPEQEKLDAVVAKLAAMSPAEILQKSIESGIHAPGGGLTKEYR